MVNHVKLEIAIQIAVERIVNIYNKIDSAKTPEELELYNQELEQAFHEKRLVEIGNTQMINKVLNRNKQEKENSQPQMGE